MRAVVFKQIVAKTIEPTLSNLGYVMDYNPPEQDFEGSIYFEKTLQEGIYIVIDFQPSFLEADNICRFAVNLGRNTNLYHYNLRHKWDNFYQYSLRNRLAPWLWIKDRKNPEWRSDQWWSFANEEQLTHQCNLVLDLLVKYGVPYLEDLNSLPLLVQVQRGIIK